MSQGLKLLTAIAERGSSVTFRLLEDFYFVDQEELSTYHYMKNHLRRYGEIPAVETVEDHLHKRLPETPEHIDYYLDKIHERHVYNGVRGVFGDLRDSLRDVDIPRITDCVSEIQRVCRPFSSQAQEVMSLAEIQPQIRKALEIRRNTYGLTGVDTGWDCLNTQTGGYTNGDLIAWVARLGIGKCLAPNTPVMDYKGGTLLAKDIVAGDRLMGPDSLPRTVMSTTTGHEDMYRISPTHGDPWECNKSHILSLRMSVNRGNQYYKGQIINISLKKYLEANQSFKLHAKLWKVPIKFPYKKTPYDPYFVGLWLGDGAFSAPTITNPEIVIKEYLRNFADANNMLFSERKYLPGVCPTYSIARRKGTKQKNQVMEYLRKYCIEDGQKVIPEHCLKNSRKHRLELLAGLLDTDGYKHSECKYEIVTKYDKLKESIVYLARSLGFSVTYSIKIATIKSIGFSAEYHRIWISGEVYKIPCRVPRKKAMKGRIVKDFTNASFTVERLGRGEYSGFSVSGDSLFVLGDFTVTHNSWAVVHKAMAAYRQGKAVLIVSMEMPLDQMANRISAYVAGVNPYYIKTGRLDNFAMEKVRDTYSTLANATNFHLYAGNFKKTTDDLDILIQELSPDVIFVDGVYLMTPTSCNARAGRYEKAAHLMDDLKRICLMRDRPLVITTQFGREAKGKGKEGSLENIGYTDTVGTHSSIVCAIKSNVNIRTGIRSQDMMYEHGPLKNDYVSYVTRDPYRLIEILKGREGEQGEFGTNFSFAPTNFTEVHVDTAKGEVIGEPDLDYMR